MRVAPDRGAGRQVVRRWPAGRWPPVATRPAVTPALVRVVVGRRRPAAAGRQPLELGLHERVEVAVEDRLGVAGLVARPQVLDHLVGVQDVAPDLVAPAGLDVLAPELAELGLLLLERALEQARLEDLDRHLLVLGLATARSGSGPRCSVGQVGQPDRRVGLVDVLAAGALGAERVDPDLVPVELDLDVVVDLGQDLDQGERRLAPLLRVERADPDEAVDAALGAQPAVGARGRRRRPSRS